MKILLATDGSTPSQEAVEEVARRPWPPGSILRVISVAAPAVSAATQFVPGALSPADLLSETEREARGLAERAADYLREHGLIADAVVRQGNPATAIVDEARDWAADLVVVGSHGRTGWGRLVLGSVSQSVVGHAPCSVEVVRHRPPAAA